MIPILVLSVIFFGIGFILNKNNAKYLLSGYNTMSENERQNYDLNSFLVFYRKFHIFLSLSLFVVASILYYLISLVWSGIFLVVYPLISYLFFIWKSGTYYRGNSKNRKIINYVSVFFMIVVLIYIVFDFNKTVKDNELIIHSNSLEINGEYGMEINLNNIKSIKLVTSYPEIISKSNGFTLGYVKKGKFITNNNKELKLLINSQKIPLILIVTKDNREIYYSSKNKSNQEIYKELILMLKTKFH